MLSCYFFNSEQGVVGPNYNLSGKLTEYSNTYKVKQCGEKISLTEKRSEFCAGLLNSCDYNKYIIIIDNV